MRVQVAGKFLAKIRDQFQEFYADNRTDSWHKLIAVRNMISHAYSDIDPSILWDVVTNRLETLRLQLDYPVDTP